MKYHCNFSFIQSRMLRRMLLNPSQEILSNQNNSKKKKKLKQIQQNTSIKTTFHLHNSVLPVFCPGAASRCSSRLYVTQLSIRIRLTVGLSLPSDRLAGSKWKSGRCCSSRSLPPSWELQEEPTLSEGDRPISARADEGAEEWWWGWTCGWVMYPDWLWWSRGGEIGSALMLMLWLVLMERVELPDLQTEEEKIWGCDSGVKMPSGGDMAVIGL